jgi:hypothetical protein
MSFAHYLREVNHIDRSNLQLLTAELKDSERRKERKYKKKKKRKRKKLLFSF